MFRMVIYLPQSLLLRDASDTAMFGHYFQEGRGEQKYSRSRLRNRIVSQPDFMG
jgi:hypothetical protein